MIFTLLVTLLVLGVLIFVHELGHFLTAKAVGIGVPRFSLGLGPKVWGVRLGETEYVISALPLGGYVRMAGMAWQEEEILEGGAASEAPPEKRFESKSLWARMLVVTAGVVMNALFAWLLLAVLVYGQGGPLPAIVGGVEAGMPAAVAGLQPGDRILAVDGEPPGDWNDFARTIQRRPGGRVVLDVERGGDRIRIATPVAQIREIDPITRDTILFGRLGVYPDTSAVRAPATLGYALTEGGRRTWAIGKQVVVFLGQLVSGRASPRDVGGVLTIGHLSGTFARAGLPQFLWLMAFLSVNLAILNLLPIPILDGGHLLFLGIEAVRGKALSVDARARLTQIGFVVIVAIMVWALTADVLRITGR